MVDFLILLNLLAVGVIIYIVYLVIKALRIYIKKSHNIHNLRCTCNLGRNNSKFRRS
jgi:uncharacterized membrane-anchored protein